MNEPAPADAVESVENDPGIDPDLALNPHIAPPAEPDGDQAEDQDGDTSSPSEETTEKKPDDLPKEDNLQKKIGELAFENRQLKRQLEQRQAQESQEANEPEPEPLKTLKDFGYDEQAFNRYLIEEGAKLGEQRARRVAQEQSGQTEAQRRADEFAAREDAFEAENPGFKTRLHDDNLRISPEMAMFIADPTSDVGLHVGDYLSRNPTESAKIAGMEPTAQMREMIKLEARIGKEVAKAKAEKTKASTAPEPPSNPVDGTDPGIGGDPSRPADADKMSDEEWIAARNRQLEKRRKR